MTRGNVITAFVALVSALLAGLWLWLWLSYKPPGKSDTPIARLGTANLATHSLNQVPCWFESPAGFHVQCARLTVTGQKQLYQLPVVVMAGIQGAEQTPGQIPLVYLGGGPGAGLGLEADAIDSWFGWYRQQALTQPLVLMDYRATGLSKPRFHCRPFVRAYQRSFIDTEQSPADDVYLATKQCLDIWRSRHFDQRDFATTAFARDVAGLMDLLDFRRYSVLAVSFGTSVARQLAQAVPERIEKLILDSPVNSDTSGVNHWPGKFTRALQQYFQQCQSHENCVFSHMDLADYLSQLKNQPRTVSIARWHEPGRWQVRVADDVFLNSFYSALYSPEKLDQFSFVSELNRQSAPPAKAELTALAAIMEPYINDSVQSNFSYFVYYANQCFENPSFDRQLYNSSVKTSPWRDYLRFNEQKDVCQLFKYKRTGPLSEFDVPIMILSGSLDPITPLRDAQQLANTLPGAQLVSFRGAGHGVLNRTECLKGMLPILLQPSFAAGQLLAGCSNARVGL